MANFLEELADDLAKHREAKGVCPSVFEKCIKEIT